MKSTPRIKKWTPGPWVDDDGVVTVRCVCFGRDIGPSYDIFDTAHCPESLEDEWEANAHLIAAAPDLVDLVESIVSEIEEYGPKVIFRSGDWFAAARAALARAYGEEQ